MDINYKSNKYIIWLYNVNAREYFLLSSNLSSEHFEIIDIVNDQTKFKELKNQSILDKPNLVICDNDTTITNEIRTNLHNSHCGLARVTTKNLEYQTDYTFELNQTEFEYLIKKNHKYIKKKETKLEFSINKLIEMMQLSQIEKWQFLSRLEAEKIMNEVNLTKSLEENKNINETIKGTLFKIAKTLNEFISFKDNYTAGHCKRVSKYAEALAISLNLSNQDIEDLILAANLHDIGKIALPDAVITKNTKLNDMEFNLMKKHVELGSSIIPNAQLGYLKAAIRGHHEKYDGSGYPDGLKGEQIPKFAQILAIADSFDAMTSQRSYNNIKSAEEAFEDLKRHTKPYGVENGLGVFYNPNLVDKFIEVISNSKTTMQELKEQKVLSDLTEYNNHKPKTNNQYVKKGGNNND